MNAAQLMHDHEARFYVRQTLDRAGCTVVGYETEGFQVAIQRGCTGQVMRAALNLNARLRHLAYFPLGTDKPPVEFRHWCGPYTPDRGFPDPGFWLYGRVEITGDIPLEISI
jgi:hypothetical protein